MLGFRVGLMFGRIGVGFQGASIGIGSSGWIDGPVLAMGGGRLVGVERMFVGC